MIGSLPNDSGDTLLVFRDPADGSYVIYSPESVAETEFPDDFTTGDIDTTTEVVVCFLAGTLIATPDGEVPVEDLAIGDAVLTYDGRTVPVRWIGRQTIVTALSPPEGRRPVRVTAGALGKGLPKRDLNLTSDHALLIDWALVHAGALVNGTTIKRIPLSKTGHQYVVYHIETEDHEVILAEGVPAESFIDNVSREHFDNYAEYEALYGKVASPMIELTQPRAMSQRQVPPDMRARISQVATTLLAADAV